VVVPCTYCPTDYEGGNCCSSPPCTYCPTDYEGGNCCATTSPVVVPCTYCPTDYEGGNCCSRPPCTYCPTDYEGGNCCSSPTCTYCPTDYDGGNCCNDPSVDPTATYTSDGYVYVVVPSAESAGDSQIIYPSGAYTEISTFWVYAWIVASIAIGMGAVLL
jgi:hypothetical protein